jgi:hypothetical protein
MTEHSQQEFCGVEFLAEDDLESVISSQQKPVLLACLLRDQHYIADICTLDRLLMRCPEGLRIAVIEGQKLYEAYGMLSLEGTPTHILFQNGEERGRIRGRASVNILTLALRGMLPATEAERWTPRQ